MQQGCFLPLCLLLCLCLLCTTVGCSAIQDGLSLINQLHADDDASQEATSDEKISLPAMVKPDADCAVSAIDDGFLVTTKYFSFELPSDWQDRVIIDRFDTDDNCYAVKLREKVSYEQGHGGHLFTFTLHPAKEVLNKSMYAGHYETIGYLTAGDQSFQLIVWGPSDVQFVDSQATVYTNMSEQLNTVVQSVKATGATFSDTNPQPAIRYLTDYLGMTLDEVESIHGTNYSEVDADTNSVYYRIVQYNHDLPYFFWESRETGIVEYISAVPANCEKKHNTTITKGLDLSATFDQIKAYSKQKPYYDQHDGNWAFSIETDRANVLFDYYDYQNESVPPKGNAVANFVIIHQKSQ